MKRLPQELRARPAAADVTLPSALRGQRCDAGCRSDFRRAAEPLSVVAQRGDQTSLRLRSARQRLHDRVVGMLLHQRFDRIVIASDRFG